MQQIKKTRKKKENRKELWCLPQEHTLLILASILELLINPRVPISISELYPLFLEERDRPPNVLNCLYCQLGLHLHIKQ